jgi:DNA polymerase I-like protein with 3'-5' exonuclease and polymerase domains
MSVQFTNQPYDRDELLEKFYKNGCIETLFGRSIEVDEFKALNYIVQSTTADLVNERAVALDAFLEGTKSFVSHIVHDEVVLDMDDEDRQLLPEIKEIFAQNRLAKFEVNFKAGKDYYNLERLNV